MGNMCETCGSTGVVVTECVDCFADVCDYCARNTAGGDELCNDCFEYYSD